jgi:hypothetical protein
MAFVASSEWGWWLHCLAGLSSHGAPGCGEGRGCLGRQEKKRRRWFSWILELVRRTVAGWETSLIHAFNALTEHLVADKLQ